MKPKLKKWMPPLFSALGGAAAGLFVYRFAGSVKRGLCLGTALCGVVHAQNGGIHPDKLLFKALFRQKEGIHQVRVGADGRHDGVHPVGEVGLQDIQEALRGPVAGFDELVGRGAGVAVP
ncbi:MAG: hypothetical protein MR014_06965 [Oscillospiraceae bacterium]|nr:hypothetical protein [Oscillospiraceae bacterium]